MRLKVYRKDTFLDPNLSAELSERAPGMSVPVVFADGMLLGVRPHEWPGLGSQCGVISWSFALALSDAHRQGPGAIYVSVAVQPGDNCSHFALSNSYNDVYVCTVFVPVAGCVRTSYLGS